MDGRTVSTTLPEDSAARGLGEDAAARSASAAPRSVLDVTALRKLYGDQVALDDISFVVHPGEVLGLIGPNGAGKTTLLEVIAGLLPADSGAIAWHGSPLPQARRRDAIFYIPDGIRPYREQPVARALAFFAAIYGRSTAHTAEVIARFGLERSLSKCVQSLSKGYARRLALALGFLTPHPLLLMDEPFDGFDLRQTRDIGNVLRQEARSGRTLLLAIHQLADAQRVCDRFILLADGRLRGIGTLAELRTRAGAPAASLEEIFLALT